MLNNIKTMQKERGFTIVELLIVIVVIGILAAITIVAYGNITTQANANAAKANAANVVKVAEAYNADDSTSGGYPTADQIKTYAGISRVPSGVSIMGGTSTTAPHAAYTVLSSTHSNGKSIQYVNKGTTGACVGYWDAKANNYAYLYAGDDKSSTNAASPGNCN
jgi:prepilin-type N-terminal cleavage/methylation domain-containing protein